MDKLTSIKAILDSIRLSEGSEFECDEKAIFDEYQIQRENKSSLAIKVLSIFGGFFATLLFLVFLIIAGLYDSPIGLVIFGIGFIALAIWLNRVYDTLIIDTFSVSTYILGFALLASGLNGMGVIDETIIALLISGAAIFSLSFTQNYILSFIAVLIINCSFLTLIVYTDYILIHLYIAINTLILTYLFLNESRLLSSNIKISKLYNPSRIGLIFSLLFGLIATSKKDLTPISQNYIWLSSIVIIFVIIYLVHTIIKITGIENIKDKIFIYALSGLILTPLFFAPSILGAIAIILLSFLVQYKTGLAIGIISFICFISLYYYDLNFTLLTKSIILFSSGITFLLFYLFTTRVVSK